MFAFGGGFFSLDVSEGVAIDCAPAGLCRSEGAVKRTLFKIVQNDKVYAAAEVVSGRVNSVGAGSKRTLEAFLAGGVSAHKEAAMGVGQDKLAVPGGG
jgi:hypothetical protein